MQVDSGGEVLDAGRAHLTDRMPLVRVEQSVDPVDVDVDGGGVEPDERPVGLHPASPQSCLQGRQRPSEARPAAIDVAVAPQQVDQSVAWLLDPFENQVDEQRSRFARVDVEVGAIHVDVERAEDGDREQHEGRAYSDHYGRVEHLLS